MTRILALCAVLSLAACSGNRPPKPPDPPDPPPPTVVPVACVVSDAKSHAMLKDALCEIEGQFGTTNADGYSIFAEVHVPQRLRVSKDGYQGVELEIYSGGNVLVALSRKHKDPRSIAVEALRAYRGAIATIQMNLPFGPRPNSDTNVLFTAMYPVYSPEDRARMRQKYKERGYTHWAIGPLNGGYHGHYPAMDFRAHPDAFLDLLQELYDDDLIPVIALIPPEGDRGYNVNGKIDWAKVDAELTPIFSTERFQDLARYVFLAWEPNPVIDSSQEWLTGVKWMERVFPTSLRAIHFTAGHGAPCNHADIQRGMTEGSCWGVVAPYVHSFFAQDASMFGWYVDPSRTNWQQFQYNVADGCKRFATGFGGWPTRSADQTRPIDWVWFEFGAYGVYNGWNTEADAWKYGDVVLNNPQCAGSGDGFTRRQ